MEPEDTLNPIFALKNQKLIVPEGNIDD